MDYTQLLAELQARLESIRCLHPATKAELLTRFAISTSASALRAFLDDRLAPVEQSVQAIVLPELADAVERMLSQSQGEDPLGDLLARGEPGQILAWLDQTDTASGAIRVLAAVHAFVRSLLGSAGPGVIRLSVAGKPVDLVRPFMDSAGAQVHSSDLEPALKGECELEVRVLQQRVSTESAPVIASNPPGVERKRETTATAQSLPDESVPDSSVDQGGSIWKREFWETVAVGLKDQPTGRVTVGLVSLLEVPLDQRIRRAAEPEFSMALGSDLGTREEDWEDEEPSASWNLDRPRRELNPIRWSDSDLKGNVTLNVEWYEGGRLEVWPSGVLQTGRGHSLEVLWASADGIPRKWGQHSGGPGAVRLKDGTRTAPQPGDLLVCRYTRIRDQERVSALAWGARFPTS